ncbi:MAG: GGDEF domain-containing protein, partial [Clostridiales bacterium]|nr:GGDEF domain-containing protein [Clostridiales bacterium]
MRQPDPEAYNQIALSLARRYDSVYYVDIDTGNYMQYLDVMDVKKSDVPRYGEHFFEDAVKNADKFIHPDDLDLIMDFFDAGKLRKNLADTGSYSFTFRAVLDGSIVHMRHIATLSEDGNHVICCLENVEEEFRKREEQKKNLKSAEMMARRDELTGVKNRTAFSETIETINQDTEAGAVDHYGVVMCDINDLKKINDTRGHAYGNEAIQGASRLICDVYKHSPVFRIGGDEFVVILKGTDYENRD